MGSKGKRSTQLVEHIGDVVPIYDPVAVSVQYLKSIPEHADLRRL